MDLRRESRCCAAGSVIEVVVSLGLPPHSVAQGIATALREMHRRRWALRLLKYRVPRFRGSFGSFEFGSVPNYRFVDGASDSHGFLVAQCGDCGLLQDRVQDDTAAFLRRLDDQGIGIMEEVLIHPDPERVTPCFRSFGDSLLMWRGGSPLPDQRTLSCC